MCQGCATRRLAWHRWAALSRAARVRRRFGYGKCGIVVARVRLMAVLPPMSTRTCILLIEDDPSLLESLRDFLEEHGFDTQTASTRSQGEEMLRQLRPAVCLLDLNLPDGSGLDLLRLIVHERLPVRVIVMSAFPLQRLRQQFPESVLAAMMTKPVSPQLLLEWVDKITRTRDAAADSP
jgi:DNA-binding response OmpR family regulator